MPPELEGRALVIKSTGKISALRNKAYQQLEASACDPGSASAVHVGIGHTRWATVSRALVAAPWLAAVQQKAHFL
jgi:glucosamine 6-phosphate synthetase-like amidotransferase/phosphosugar isomerase protein